MTQASGLADKRAALAAAETELAGEKLKFEDSVADLRKRCEELRREYARALRAELARVEVAHTARPDLAGILAAIERTHQPIIVRRIRELADRYISPTRREPPPPNV